jgi:integrase
MKEKHERKNRRRKNHEGTVYQGPDGRWVAMLSTDGGKRKALYGATAEEVQDKLTRARNQQLDHIPFTDERLTVAHWLDTWLRNVRPPATAPKTWISYEGYVRLHLIPQLGHIRLVKLSHQNVRDFISERLDGGLSECTVKHLRDTLRAALNQAMKDGLIHRNVASEVKPPEITPKELDVYTPEEARQLLDAVRGHRLEALFTVAIAIALRLGECLGLQWPDVDFNRRRLTVRHNLQRLRRVRRGDVVKEGEAKTERLLGRPKGKKIHPLPLPVVVFDALRQHQARQQEERKLAGTKWKGDGRYVFTSTIGTPIERRSLERIFKHLCAAAGLRQIRFHDLRHSAVSILIALGVHPKAIQALLRHSSIRITMDIYGHLFDQVQQETADKMDEVLGRRKDEENPETAIKTAINSKPEPVQ